MSQRTKHNLLTVCLLMAFAPYLLSVRPTHGASDTEVSAPKPLKPAEVSIAELNHDITKLDQQPQQWMTLILWMPTEFWQAAMAGNKDVTKKQADDVIKSLSKYTVLMVMCADTSDTNDMQFDSEDQLRKVVKIEDSAGNSYEPLDPSDVDVTASATLAAMKPAMAKATGAMGNNMFCLVFPATDKNGKPIAKAAADGKFTIEVGAKKYDYRLPLPSLVQKRECPVCHEKLQGSYHFCPYDGAKLIEAGK